MSAKITTLSIVVTAHAEGILLHRTLLSVLRATRQLSKEKVTWEILIHVDNGTIDTMDYIKSNNAFLNQFSIYYNTFSDLATSRNYMVSVAKGRHIAFLDADDLISESWFLNGLAFLKELKKPAILHTEWLINFGEQNLVWHKYNSRSKEEDALIMTWANRWDSAVIASRQIFEAFPYAPNTHGYGSEDHHFNSQTLAAGIPHYVVPETVLFYRRKDVSEMTIQKGDSRTIHYTDLLDINFFKRMDLEAIGLNPRPHKSSLRRLIKKLQSLAFRLCRKGYHLSLHTPLTAKFANALKDQAALIKKRHMGQRFPNWLIAEWREMHSIDKQLFPDEYLLQTIPLYISEMYDLGITYQKLTQYVTKYPDYIVLVPHLVAGGADLVVLNYVRAIKTIHPDWKILLIATDDTPSPWVNRLPKKVDFMPWGAVCAANGLWKEVQLQLLARLIVQLRCKKLHIIQSALAYEFVAKYKSLLTSNDYSIYATVFCEDVDKEGRFIGHIHSGLPGAYPVLKAITSDNQAVINQLVHEYGYSPRKFTAHYQPAEIENIHPPKQSTSTPYRVIWASRLATQKRPDILKRIAEKLDPDLYRLEVYGSLYDGFTPEYFSGIPALCYKGSFNGLGSINLDYYDAFLYTSANDGIPNVLTGMTAAGLPIVASNAGGVGEFVIDHKTGLLIDPIDNIDAYLHALEELRKDHALASTMVKSAQRLLKDRHSQDAFEMLVRKMDL